MTTSRNILRILTAGSFGRLTQENKATIIKYCQQPDIATYLTNISTAMGGGLFPIDTSFSELQYMFVNICTKIDTDNIDLIGQMFEFAIMYHNTWVDSGIASDYVKMQKEMTVERKGREITYTELVNFSFQWAKWPIARKGAIEWFKASNIDFCHFYEQATANGVWLDSMGILGDIKNV